MPAFVPQTEGRPVDFFIARHNFYFFGPDLPGFSPDPG